MSEAPIPEPLLWALDHSKCGPWTSSLSLTWALVRKAKSQAIPRRTESECAASQDAGDVYAQSCLTGAELGRVWEHLDWLIGKVGLVSNTIHLSGGPYPSVLCQKISAFITSCRCQGPVNRF